jgi:hypothetical protein
MKYLVLALLTITSAHATVLSQYISSPDGSSEQRFVLTKNAAKYEKRSNFFDKTKSFTLGEFELTNEKVSAEDMKQIEKILGKIKDVDKFLKAKNSSFNDLSTKAPHDSFIILDEYRISQKSDLYPELKQIYDRLLARNWKQESGIKLSEDLKTLTIIKNGKEASKESFNFGFHCQKAQAPTVCGYKNLGILFVQ